MNTKNSFNSKQTLNVGSKMYSYFSLNTLEEKLGVSLNRLPMSLKILLENLLRREDGSVVRKEDIEAIANWNPKAAPSKEIAFMPARVLLQDFTGVPCVVDLAVMRDAMIAMGGDPNKINPLQSVDLVIDHSVQVDEFGTPNAFQHNAALEFERNKERYSFLRWGQQAFKNFRVVPPDTGIVHQVNLEYLANVVFNTTVDGETLAYPDTLVGTDSHTTMINGLGVLGWGVGGIEAEAAMLGQPVSMLIPQVVGFKLSGKLKPGATATDLVLTVTQMLRKKGVVGKFVEYFGDGLSSLSLADRATIANMAPEYGATMGFFPVDQETINFLKFTGRSEEQVALVEAYLKSTGFVSHNGNAAAGIFRHARTRPCHSRAKYCRTETPAGSRSTLKSKNIISLFAGRIVGSQGHNNQQRRNCAMAEQRRNRSASFLLKVCGSKRQICIYFASRFGSDCGYHKLHEHIESFCIDCGRTAGEESSRERTCNKAMGEDKSCTRL